MPDFRQKTIKVPVNFGNVSDISNTTLTSIGTPTIYIPENDASSVTFNSAMLYFQWEDKSTGAGANASNITEFQTEIQLQDAGSPSNVTVTQAAGNILQNTGENMSGIFGPIDYTTYFSTGGGWDSDQISQTCEVKIQINSTTTGVAGFRSVYAWFEITYVYPVDAATYIQTICLPYETYPGNIPATATEVGTLPQLTTEGGILAGYNTPVVRHRWIELKGSDGVTNTTDPTLNYSFDGDTLTSLPVVEAALQSTRYHTYLIDASELDPTTSHTFELASLGAIRFSGLVINEWISFEYTVSETTRVLNYIEVPIEFDAYLNGTTAGVNSSFTRELLIPEKNITQLNCAAEINFNIQSPNLVIQVKAGNQASYRGYSINALQICCAIPVQHRFDAGSASGEGIALTSGLNTLSLFLYQSATLRNITNISGLIKIAYLSDVSDAGLHNHTQTVKEFIRQPAIISSAGVANPCSNTSSFSIPNTDYYIQSAGLHYNMWAIATTMGITSRARILSGEGVGEGYRVLYSDSYQAIGEIAYTPIYVRARDEFKRYPGDVDNNRMDIESNREFQFVTSAGVRVISTAWNVAYHGITHIISGSVTGSSGASSTLQLFQVVDGEYNLYKTGSISGDSAFEFIVYDDTTPYTVSAYANSSLKGLSKSATPSEGFDIDYASGGGGGGAGGEFFF